MKKLIDKKLIKFIIVGVINTFVGMVIMFGLYNFAHLSYWISSAVNYILTSILSYFLNKHFTFQNKETGAAQVIRFAINIAACYLLAYGIAKPAIQYILQNADTAMRDNISMFVGMCLFTMFNYLGQRFFAFKEK